MPRNIPPHDRQQRGAIALAIDSVGVRGDGVANMDGTPVYVAGTLAGERVRAVLTERRGDGWVAALEAVELSAADRVTPPCRHFGTCGGCALQHMSDQTYAVWKRDLLITTLARRGLDVNCIAPLVRVAPGLRRRAACAFVHRSGGVTLGFNIYHGNQIINLTECPLLLPELVVLIESLRPLLATVTNKGDAGDVTMTATDTGIDVLVTAESGLDLTRRQQLADFANAHDIARISWRSNPRHDGEPVVIRNAPTARFVGVAVELPPGCFLQPSANGEAAIVSVIMAAIGGRFPVGDFYAGVGSFTFPLAYHAGATGKVHAVEGSTSAATALQTGARRAGLTRITTEVRNLASRPLAGKELQTFAAIVFDPPRAGAAAQARALATDGPDHVVAVSCDPSTLTRDLLTLIGGGYRLESLTPIDQFPWSPHLEAVAVLTR